MVGFCFKLNSTILYFILWKEGDRAWVSFLSFHLEGAPKSALRQQWPLSVCGISQDGLVLGPSIGTFLCQESHWGSYRILIHICFPLATCTDCHRHLEYAPKGWKYCCLQISNTAVVFIFYLGVHNCYMVMEVFFQCKMFSFVLSLLLPWSWIDILRVFGFRLTAESLFPTFVFVIH